MAVDETYRRQVALLVRTLPFVAEETCFALKGGTAINLFIRDMPRLSVDIDLTYLPLSDRAASLSEIDSTLRRIGARITDGLVGAHVYEGMLHGENTVNKLVIRVEGVQVKLRSRQSCAARCTSRKSDPFHRASKTLSVSQRFKLSPLRTCTPASLSQPWTVSIHGTCSMSATFSLTRASTTRSERHF